MRSNEQTARRLCRRRLALAGAALIAALALPLAAPTLTRNASRALAQAEPTQTAADITDKCAYECAGKHTKYTLLWAGGYEQTFIAKDGALTITAPEGGAIAAVYLCFNSLPVEYAVDAITPKGESRPIASRKAEFLHELISFEPSASIRLRTLSGEPLKLDALRVFAPGALPPEVQAWQPSYERCDILLFVAHPDDELLFFGGLIPWYEGLGYRVLVATMTCRSHVRAHELLDALWTAGMRSYPDIGDFRDRATRNIEDIYDIWTREEADYRFVELVRGRRPAVVVTHGVKGEYGHGAHKACADIALRLFYKCADDNYLPQLTRLYGAYQPQKLYLHQYPDNKLTMDWERSVKGSAADRTAADRTTADRTAADIAREAFKMHRSQRFFDMQLSPDDPYCACDFGLAESTVGLDVLKDDLLENTKQSE